MIIEMTNSRPLRSKKTFLNQFYKHFMRCGIVMWPTITLITLRIVILKDFQA